MNESLLDSFIHALGFSRGQEEPLLCCVFHFHLSQATFIFVCVELWDAVLWIRRFSEACAAHESDLCGATFDLWF